jgi:hypothetical protein
MHDILQAGDLTLGYRETRGAHDRSSSGRPAHRALGDPLVWAPGDESPSDGYRCGWRREGAAGSAGRTESTSEARTVMAVASSSA